MYLHIDVTEIVVVDLAFIAFDPCIAINGIAYRKIELPKNRKRVHLKEIIVRSI
jgi:hypothetical protein